MQYKRARRISSAHWIALLAIIFGVGGIYLLVVALAPLVPRGADIGILLAATGPGERGDRLYIPRLGTDTAITAGTDERALDSGVWHRKPRNGDPARGGNFILSAHRFAMGWTPAQTIAKSPFYHIDVLVPGDDIIVDYGGKRYQYKVTRRYAVPRTAVAIEAASLKPKMTLYSCDLRGEVAGRYVIEAAPIDRA